MVSRVFHTIMTPHLKAVHTKVRGRARFKLESLPRASETWSRIDAEIRRLPGVREVRANSITGSLLVHFEPEEEWRSLADRIERMIQTAVDARPQRVSEPPSVGTKIPAAFVTGSEDSPNWHQLAADHILKLVDTSIELGLDPHTADHRLRIHGSNLIQEARLRRRRETLKDQLMLLPLALLMVESAAALFGGAGIEAAILSAITAINVLVGYFIDRRAEQALAEFKRRPQAPALVLRGGAWIEVPGDNLVVGDVVKLMPGTLVGADCRILESSHLKIDESILTGESNPVEKHADVVPGVARPLFDQLNMVFMGTLVVGGGGIAVVVSTGPLTEYGKLSVLFDETIPPQTPVIGKIHALSGTLLKSSLTISFGVFMVNLLGGRGLPRAIGRALSLAAAGIPAGLPSAATVNMALGFRRLKRENVSIRRLYSLESLSALEMVCFDKTGTLTRSRISVQRIFCAGKDIHVDRRLFTASGKTIDPLENPDLRRLFQACVLCTEARIYEDPETGRRRISGSPTETALLHLAVMAEFDLDRSYRRHVLQKVRHRADYQRHMITVHTALDGRNLVFVKGAPAEVLEMCSWQLQDGRRVKLTAAAESDIEIQNQILAGDALRVLGFAWRYLDTPPDDTTALSDLTWIGLVGMAEPIRQGVISLIERLHRAGIRTVMITGDQSNTAEAIARRIRLNDGAGIRIFDSSRFDALTPELASALVRDVQVFARVNPSQKLRIIQAYQDRGMVVAMTGDGINDGPALRAADVGIAMGISGTAAARGVADMILDRDNISSVATAVVEGRAAFRNLKRALRFFIASKFSDLLLTAAASTISPAAALLTSGPVQIDLLTDLTPGLALLMESASPDIEHEPPRNREDPLFSPRDLQALFSESAVLAGGALTAFGYGLMRHGPGSRAATLAYESLFSGKVLHALTCRPRSPDVAKPGSRPANPFLNAALVAALAAQAGTILIPGLRRLFRVAPLGMTDLAVVGMTAWATLGVNHRIRENRRIESKAAE